jgi:hypothetical protein
MEAREAGTSKARQTWRGMVAKLTDAHTDNPHSACEGSGEARLQSRHLYTSDAVLQLLMKAYQHQSVFGLPSAPDVEALLTFILEITDTETRWDCKPREMHTPAGQTKKHKLKSPKSLMRRELTVQLQSLRKMTESTDKLLSSHALSDTAKADVLEKTASLVYDIFQASQNHIPFEDTLLQKAKGLQQQTGDIFVHRPKPEARGQTPDVSNIPLWRGRKQDGMPLDFIKAHYGRCLSAFGAEQDTLFQDQIRTRDPKLLQGVSNQLHEEGQGRKLRDFVKPRSVRTARELESFDLETLKQAHRIKGLLSRRRRKKEAPQDS